jgi:hypothetical protein
MSLLSTIIATLLVSSPGQPADETVFEINAKQVVHRISPLLQGACIEDVNHEIYGGLYSQMIFGESFQEPAPSYPIKKFQALGGRWTVRDGVLQAEAGDGPKLVGFEPLFADGDVAVDLKFDANQAGNAGLIVRVDRPEIGADSWTGYEVSLETAGFLVLGRHRRNWEPILRVPCEVPLGRWITLEVRMKGNMFEVLVDGQSRISYTDTDHPLGRGLIGLRDWQRPVSYRNLRVRINDSDRIIPFQTDDSSDRPRDISGMWGGLLTESAQGQFELIERDPFVGRQSQRVTFIEGSGTVGVANKGLNHWGLNIVGAKPYEGQVWARAEAPVTLTLGFASANGRLKLGETRVEVQPGGWKRYDFTLTPSGSDTNGRFVISLDRPGSVDLGYVFLQPGDWGRFAGLPVRKDVADGLIDEGIAILRYGGSMVNHPQYRWKSMIGPRDRRQPSAGTWYPYSTNGWGIIDFLAFCRASKIQGIPAVNMSESPQDMVDFLEYVNGPADSPWGRKRVEDGFAEPFHLTHLELGNEEAINEDYWKKFEPMAQAIWAKDPSIILIVGDFAYTKVINNAYQFDGGAVVNSLATHRKILELAKSKGREIWFDIHVWTDHPPEPDGMKPERSYIDQLGKLAPDANYKVVIFEYNSGNPAMKRALSNALATIEAERIGDRLPIACAANCLQPDGQNDNGWDQGLLFLNPSKTWLQPPGWLIKLSRSHPEPLLVQSAIQGPSTPLLNFNARRSDDGKSLILQVVNASDEPKPVRIEIAGFVPSKPTATVEELAGPLEARNTAGETGKIVPRTDVWKHQIPEGKASYTFPAYSITFLHLD